MAKSVLASLKAKQSMWAGTTAAAKGGKLPDGEYVGVIEDLEVGKSQQGSDQVTWKLLITEGDCEGKRKTKWSSLESDKGISYLKRDMEALGLDEPAKIEDLPRALGPAIGKIIRFEVWTNGEFTNVDFMEEIASDGAAEPDAEEPEAEGLSAADITAMGAEDDQAGLQAIIDENELDVDQDEYATYAEVADVIIKELSLE